MNGGARAESGVRGVVPGRGFRSERGGGSKVERLGTFSIEGNADVLMTTLLVDCTSVPRKREIFDTGTS